MRLLLDTHAWLWWLTGDRRLPVLAREAISDSGNAVLVSAATIWELAIKQALRKIRLDFDLTEAIASDGFAELPVQGRHAMAAARLDPHHTDPFDRMLIAQTRVEGLVLVTRDPEIRKYDVPVLWK